MSVSSLPWNCPNPYCEDPHNPTTIIENGVARCHSCGWERRVTAPKPESLDDFPELFQPREEPKKD